MSKKETVKDALDKSNNNNNKDNKENPNEITKKKVMEFNEEEFELYNDTNKKLGIDAEELSDLKQIEIPKPLTPKEIDNLIKDGNKKVLQMDRGSTPALETMLGENDRLKDVADEDLETMRADRKKEYNKLITILTAKPYVTLSLKVGVKDGKSIFVQKDFWFNSLDNQEEFYIRRRAARWGEIQNRYAAIVSRPAVSWKPHEAEFAAMAQAMLEVVSYQNLEYEAMLRFGMTKEEYAKVDESQYKLLLKISSERINNPSSSSAEQ